MKYWVLALLALSGCQFSLHVSLGKPPAPTPIYMQVPGDDDLMEAPPGPPLGPPQNDDNKNKGSDLNYQDAPLLKDTSFAYHI